MTVIIGMGAGRSGTQSLARLINEQPNAVCFHEINPACMAWSEARRTVLSMIAEFGAVLDGGPREVTIDLTSPKRDVPLPRMRSLERITVLGDIASYYLPYVPILAELDLDVRMPCLRRERAATIRSFLAKVRIRRSAKQVLLDRLTVLVTGCPYHSSRNHWMEHDGRCWQSDLRWDKCFPNFQADSLEDAIGLYVDHYYDLAEVFSQRYSGRFRIFDIEALNTKEGQAEILQFCGLTENLVHKRYRVNTGVGG